LFLQLEIFAISEFFFITLDSI